MSFSLLLALVQRHLGWLNVRLRQALWTVNVIYAISLPTRVEFHETSSFTVCPRSLHPFYIVTYCIVTYYIKRVKTEWTCGTHIDKKGTHFATVGRLSPIAKFNLFYWLVYRHDVEFNALSIDYMLHKGLETYTHVL